MRADIADEVGHVLRCRAVDADGCDLALLVEQPRAVCDGIATAGVRLILARERDPGPHVWVAVQVREDGQRLIEQRQRLAGQDVRLSRDEDVEALRMEV